MQPSIGTSCRPRHVTSSQVKTGQGKASRPSQVKSSRGKTAQVKTSSETGHALTRNPSRVKLSQGKVRQVKSRVEPSQIKSSRVGPRQAKLRRAKSRQDKSRQVVSAGRRYRCQMPRCEPQISWHLAPEHALQRKSGVNQSGKLRQVSQTRSRQAR